ncbi:MAG: trehalose-phosphatase [Hyphomicrobiales bacterium]|nr:trehalose-phosphatase [Hyphomicrobiales bacterium]
MAKGISPTCRFATASDKPVALFLDVDGTLLDFAERPHEVVTPAGLVATLAKAERKLEGALALVSGCAIDDLDRRSEPLRLRASGVHGAQMRYDPGEPAAPAPAAVELPAPLWAALTRSVGKFPCAFAENKRFSFAVHYRLAPSLEKPLRETVMRLVNSQPQIAIEIVNAHYAFELRAPGFDKGKAIAAFLSCPRFRGRTPIFGGDETDEAGFPVVSTRGGFAFSVGRPRPRALGAFAHPSEVRQWLADFAECGGGA